MKYCDITFQIDCDLNDDNLHIYLLQLSLCQKQLKEALDSLKDVKDRLHKTQDAHNLVHKDYDKVIRQVSIFSFGVLRLIVDSGIRNQCHV